MSDASWWSRTLCVFLWCAMAAAGEPFVRREADAWIVGNGVNTMDIDPRTGAIRAVWSGRDRTATWHSGEFGLWRITFADGSHAQASEVGGPGASTQLTITAADGAQALLLRYRSDDLEMAIRMEPRDAGIDLSAEVAPSKKTVFSLELPARLRFSPDSVRRFVFPGRGNMTVGSSFNASFFRRQSPDLPGGWRYVATGPEAYRSLAGAYLQSRAVDDPPVALHVTDMGRMRIGTAEKGVEGRTSILSRVTLPSDEVEVLVDSAHGPYFTAQTVGTGRLWRISGARREDDAATDVSMVTGALDRLAHGTATSRTKVGLLDVFAGPRGGSWTAVPVQSWRDVWHRMGKRPEERLRWITIGSPSELDHALASGEFLAILNPYGEGLPVHTKEAMRGAVSNIGAYVRAGGHWFEVGGYPFHYALVPEPFLSYGGPRPNLFADFAQLDTAGDSVALWGIQPRGGKSWNAAVKQADLFVPGSLTCGGDAEGGFLDRGFGTHVVAGSRWRSPVTRVVAGRAVEDSLRAYAEANDLGPKLADKLPAATYEKLKDSVLLYVDGTAREKMELLPLLPSPSILHFADYLKGGFDKEYPDHLPPNPAFGTAAELREFIAAGRAAGHLIMPYTNPTWWCDHPRGPTFEREGDAPLLRDVAGRTVREDYGGNDGFTVCPWHPAVRAANSKTVAEFVTNFPVDLLFQDQLGARSWQRDFNAASPWPPAYAHGVVAQGYEDARKLPLATEDGHDLVAGCESLFCGMTWGLVPFAHPPAWRRLMREEIPPGTWNLFPLAHHLTHERVAFYHHDLGAFVTSRETLAWSLALGYGMSYRVPVSSRFDARKQEWVRWLDRVQKSVARHYVGQPVMSFAHTRVPGGAAEDDGVIAARYGTVEVVANLGPTSRNVGAYALLPFGFHARGTDFVAGEVLAGTNMAAYVIAKGGDGTDVWVYARPGLDVCLPWTEKHDGYAARMENGAELAVTPQQNGIVLSIPTGGQADRRDVDRVTHYRLVPR